MKQRCFHDLLAEKAAFESQQEAVGLSTRKEQLIRGKYRGVPTTEQAEEFCAMGNNSDDGEPKSYRRGSSETGRHKGFLG